jgi:hypothetical protein
VKKLMSAFNSLRAMSRDEVKAVERINRAFGIAQRKGGLGAYLRENQYMVFINREGWQCTCPDWQYRTAQKRAYEGYCKHIEASRIVAAATSIACDMKIVGALANNSLVFEWVDRFGEVQKKAISIENFLFAEDPILYLDIQREFTSWVTPF